MKPVSARLPEDVLNTLCAQVEAGAHRNLSRAIAHYVRLGIKQERQGQADGLEETMRRVMREELARVRVAQATAPDKTNHKRTRMLEKVQR